MTCRAANVQDIVFLVLACCLFFRLSKREQQIGLPRCADAPLRESWRNQTCALVPRDAGYAVSLCSCLAPSRLSIGSESYHASSLSCCIRCAFLNCLLALEILATARQCAVRICPMCRERRASEERSYILRSLAAGLFPLASLPEPVQNSSRMGLVGSVCHSL